MCSGRSGPSYAAWSAVRASFSCARSRGPRCWAPAGRLPPVGLPPDGPRPPDLPRVSPDRLAPPRSRLGSHRGSRLASRSATRRGTTSCRGHCRTSHLVRRRTHLVTVAVLDGPRPQPHFPSPRLDTPYGGNATHTAPGNGAGATRSLVAPAKCLSGGVLLSHNLSVAVPSALKGLTSGFGMGPGVSRFAMAAVTLSTSIKPPRHCVPWGGFVGWELLSGREHVCVCVFVGLRGRTCTSRVCRVCGFVRGWDKPSAY